MLKTVSTFDPRQELKAGSFEIQHKRDMDLTNVALHHHDFYEIYYLVSGDVTYQIEGKLCRVSPGQLLLISPQELHQVFIDEGNRPYERYVLWVQPEKVRQLSAPECDLECGLDASQKNHQNLLHPDNQLRQIVRWNMETLYQESEGQQYGAGLLADSCLRQLLVLIGRLQERQTAPMQEETGLAYRVVAYLAAHYAEKITLDQLAARFYVSKYHLCHEFQKHIGTGVYQYLQKKRLQIAKELLRQGASASEAGMAVGFADYAGFYRAFQQEYGSSPKAFAQGTQVLQ